MVGFKFAIDRGGTFTDIVAFIQEAGSPAERIVTMKLPSNSKSYADAYTRFKVVPLKAK
jgi:N-methylhydantoinase A/oxoprolinase/acetone carboxylase beta subunit